jgi:CMP-N-acetylneuraminic acid synthetase
MKIVALVPMKLNSERVPSKNFKSFNEKPLYQWIIETLLSINFIDQIVINTDARSALEENELFNTKRILIRERKGHLCGDKVPMNNIIFDDVENIKADFYIMTHTTNPLLKSETICQAFEVFKESWISGKADSLFSVNKVQTRFYFETGLPVNHDPNNLIPTQELEPWFEENSNFYIFTQSSFNTTKSRIGTSPILFETPRLESIDIDTHDDWNMALLASKVLNSF